MDDLTTTAHFPAADRERWRALVEAALKGAGFERRLVARTRDGVRLEPLYAPAPETAQPWRGVPGPWRVTARVDEPEPDEAAALALADLEGGVGGLDLVFSGAPSARGHGLAVAGLDDLDRALAGIAMPLVRIGLDAGAGGRGAAALLVALAYRRGHALAELDLDLGLDPLGAFAATGGLSAPWPIVASRAAETLAALDAEGFAGTILRADGRPFHEGGASEAQELGAVLATGVAYLRALEAGGHDLARARGAIAFRMAADADVLMTVAKFRALRRLWASVESACGLDPASMRLDAETAWRTMTRRDPWVNVLRGGVAAFAAGLGGADAVAVLPFTAALGLPDAFARRLARNAQTVILEEAQLWRIADPAAGAGGFEAATDALSEAGWAAFQAIEAEGGIVASLVAGALQARIAEVASARRRDVATRREPITGTSEFPQLGEALVAVRRPAPAPGSVLEADELSVAGSPTVVAFADLVARALDGEALPAMPRTAVSASALLSERLAEPFERLRDAAEQRAGGPPRLFLATLGPVAAHTARAAFARNAFAVGGIEAVEDAGAETPDALAAAFRVAATDRACLCGSDEAYAEHGEAAARALREAGARQVWLAGRPGDAEAAWRTAGVTGFVYAGCDLLVVLAEAMR